MDNETPSTPQPEPAPEPKKQDGRARNGATFYEHGKKPRKIDAEKILPQAINAVLNGKSLSRVTAPLSHDGRRYLQQAMKQDVDQWRAEFASKLRSASEEMLQEFRAKIGEIPPASLAYSLAVVIDKAQALEGKNALNNASVNVQINNYGSVSKEDLIKKLHGQIDELPVVEAKE
jgi:hypothetical protein